MVFGIGATVALASGSALGAQNDVPPDVMREARGMWVATVGGLDWPTTRGIAPEHQKKEALAILDRAAHLRMNMIVLQVRPCSDALYPSALYPWSPYVSGHMGLDPGYDVLDFWITEAHKRGLELHAWLNPYRVATNLDVANSSNSVVNQHPGLVRRYGGQLWLDPGEPDSLKLILDGLREIVSNYDLDGVHFDDYFYPYPNGSEPFPDDGTFQKMGGTDKGDWRRSNVDALVEQAHDLIHSIKPWVKFGISPFGIWRPGYPDGVVGLNSMTEIFADSRTWLQNGWVDYLSPQLYWKISAPRQPFGRLLRWWTGQNPMGRHIWPGLYDSQTAWAPQEILGQVRLTRELGAGGNLHFSARALMKNSKSLATLLLQKSYNAPALVPASPWLIADGPAAPKIGRVDWDGVLPAHVEWSVSGADASGPGAGRPSHGPEALAPARFWLIAMRYGATWSFRVLPGETLAWDLPGSTSSGLLQKMDIAALDRAENLGPWAEVVQPPRPVGSSR